MKMEVWIGVMQPQVKELLESTVAEEGRINSPLESLEGDQHG
jgi:hypothetical protein